MSRTAHETVALLEQRLERVEFHLRQSEDWSKPSHDGDDHTNNDETVAKRLSRLEKRLAEGSAQGTPRHRRFCVYVSYRSIIEDALYIEGSC